MRSLMVTMVKSSDSELPVLDFSRARNFRRACVVRKLGIWERDWSRILETRDGKSSVCFLRILMDVPLQYLYLVFQCIW